LPGAPPCSGDFLAEVDAVDAVVADASVGVHVGHSCTPPAGVVLVGHAPPPPPPALPAELPPVDGHSMTPLFAPADGVGMVLCGMLFC
jgi:hypothetical protein